MQTFSKIIFSLLILIFSFLGLSPESCNVLAQDLPASSEIKQDENKGRLCGIYSLYLSLLFLGESSGTYENLLEKFPDAAKEGTSLFQIRTFLENRGYVCRITEMAIKDFVKLPTGSHALVLEEHAHDLGAPHILFVRVLQNAALQIVDYPVRNEKIENKDLSERKIFALFVGKDASSLPLESFFSGWRIFVAWGVLGVAFLFFGWRVYSVFLRKKARDA